MYGIVNDMIVSYDGLEIRLRIGEYTECHYDPDDNATCSGNEERPANLDDGQRPPIAKIADRSNVSAVASLTRLSPSRT